MKYNTIYSQQTTMINIYMEQLQKYGKKKEKITWTD